MIIDYTTKNESFLKVSEELCARGVRNHAFMLRLHDKSLKGINPYDMDLDADTRFRISTEASMNIWYYLREIVRLPTLDGSVIRFGLTLANAAQTYCAIHELSSFVTTPRQTFRSISTSAIIKWFIIVNRAQGYDAHLIDKSKANALQSNKRIEENIMLPWYFYNQSHKKGNIFSENSARSEIDTETLGRGISDNVIRWFDEYDFIKYGDVILNNGNQHGFDMLTSVYGDIYTEQGRKAIEFREQCAEWDDSLYDVDIQSIKDYAHNYNGFIYIEYSFVDMVEDADSTFKLSCESLLNDTQKIYRELHLIPYKFDNNNPLFTDPNDQKYILTASTKRYKRIILDSKFLLKQYDPADKNKKYIISIDYTANNQYGSKYTGSISVIESNTCAIAAEFCKLDILLEDMIHIVRLITERYPNNIITCASNRRGKSIVHTLFNRYRNMNVSDIDINTAKIKTMAELIRYNVHNITGRRMVREITAIADINYLHYTSVLYAYGTALYTAFIKSSSRDLALKCAERIAFDDSILVNNDSCECNVIDGSINQNQPPVPSAGHDYKTYDLIRNTDYDTVKNLLIDMIIDKDFIKNLAERIQREPNEK